MNRTRLLATLVLLGITACWGSTFFLIHDLLDRIPAVDFLAVRFSIAAVLLLVVAPKAVLRLSPATRRQALVLGCFAAFTVSVGMSMIRYRAWVRKTGHRIQSAE